MKSILYMLLVACAFWGCSSDKEETPVGGIAGSVSDKTTGEPVATANVKLSTGESTVTGSDGTFSFMSLTPGTYSVDIVKEGYKPNSTSVSVGSGEQVAIHLLLERLPAIVTANPATLEFGENVSNTTLSFTILNPSYDDLDWQIETDCGWITVQPLSGCLKYGKTETIIVNIDRTQLSSNNQSGGTDYESVIVVKSSDGNAEIKVNAVGKYHENPEFNILEATKVLATSATLNGIVSYAGAPQYYERGFVFHTESSPTLENNIERLKVQGTSDQNYSYVVTNLTPNTTYYARAYVITSYGVYYSSNVISFTTRKMNLYVTVQDPTELNHASGSVVLHGTVVGDGIVCTERGFVYGIFNNPTIGENTKVVAQGNGTGEYSCRVLDLPLKQTYYVRAYVLVNDDIVYSDSSVIFSTMPILAKVTTQEPLDVDIAAGTATLRGTIVSAGSPAYTERGFVYSTMRNPTIYDNKIVANGVEVETSFSVYTDALPKGKDYFVRAYAINAGETAYGEEVEMSFPWVELSAIGIAVQKEDIGYNTWGTADSKCKNSTLGGYTDWRLPTREELMTLYLNRNTIGGFKTSSSKGYHYHYYWSSERSGNNSYYYIKFSNGQSNLSDYSESRSARCVRTIGIND